MQLQTEARLNIWTFSPYLKENRIHKHYKDQSDNAVYGNNSFFPENRMGQKKYSLWANAKLLIVKQLKAKSDTHTKAFMRQPVPTDSASQYPQ
jgi:hypothetical protein